MARFQLNPRKANNFAFFCPNSRLHLTVSNPVGSASEVTPAIIRGVKSQTLIDIDGVVKSGGQAKTEDSGAAPTPKNEPQPVPTQQQEEKSSPKGRSKGKAAAKSTEAEAPAENTEPTANAEAEKAAE